MNRAQKGRLLIVAMGVMALAVFARHMATRIQGPAAPAQPAAASPTPPPAADRLLLHVTLPRQAELLALARQTLEEGVEAPVGSPAQEAPAPAETVFVSLSRADGTALVGRGEGTSLEEAVTAAAGDVAMRASPQEVREGLIKVDVLVWTGEVERFDADGGSRVDRSLEGVWLPRAGLQLLPEELLSRRLMTSSGDLQSKRLRRYLEESPRRLTRLPENPARAGDPYHRLRFASFVEGAAGKARQLYRGNVLYPDLEAESLLAAARAGGEYLLAHGDDDGTFGYSYEPKQDEYNDDYNLLRHAGTCYALAELYQATGDERYLDRARRGLEALLRTTRGPRPEDAGSGFLAVVSPGEEAKLGGAALAVLALLEYEEASGDRRWHDQVLALARFLAFMQDPDGRFRSKYFYGAPDPEPFESIYYPGEAILALVRLSRVEADPLWLQTSRRGADWLIGVRDAGKGAAELPHDHWLLMGLDELHAVTGSKEYAAHAGRIGEAILGAQRRTHPEPDWIGSFYDPPRSTPTATRAEGLVARLRLAGRTGEDPQPILTGLLLAAGFQLRCQITPENALYLPASQRALGGFRRSLTNWEVRIDYVQHNVSALLGLRAALLEREAALRAAAER